MVAAVRVHKVGGPEVLTYEDVEVAAPGPGRSASSSAPAASISSTPISAPGSIAARGCRSFPAMKAAGEVVAVGEGVTDFKVGDRVTYDITLGGYAAERLLPAERAVKLPDGISYEQAAGMMLKGMTARYLLRRTFKVEKGRTC